MLTLSLRSFYLPREFPTLVLSTVYIPPRANNNTAAEVAARCANRMQDKYPDAPVFILGDFNGCRLDNLLPSLHQYADTPTRRDNILDKCYGSIKDAYRAQTQPPLGSADHNIVVLLPQYTEVLKRHKPETYSVNHWSEEAIADLQGSLACIDWMVFDIDIEIITDYIKFCMANSIPARTIKKYPNSRPWMTAQIKLMLREKKKKNQAFK